jgi:hypothetical protein
MLSELAYRLAQDRWNAPALIPRRHPFRLGNCSDFVGQQISDEVLNFILFLFVKLTFAHIGRLGRHILLILFCLFNAVPELAFAKPGRTFGNCPANAGQSTCQVFNLGNGLGKLRQSI